MPKCYECLKDTPVTTFYMLRVYLDGNMTLWWYACSWDCLKLLVRDHSHLSGEFLLREYLGTCGKAWKFKTAEELKKFVVWGR